MMSIAYNQDELKLKKIHEASMSILEETGMKFYHPEILEILEHKGVKVSGKTAFFTQDQIMKWIKKAPSNFTLYARNPKYNMFIGGDHIEYAAGYGAPAIIEIDGTKRNALLSDYVKFLKLVHQTDYFRINGGILVQPSDLDPANSYPIMLYSTIAHSDKCIMGGPGGVRETRIVMEILSILFGGRENLIAKPRIISIINTTSPLMIDKDSLDTLLIYARNGQPVMITPSTMAGTTGPVTLAGTIALANAEALAGIAVTQMIRKGAPVMYGFMSDTADMRTCDIGRGSPEGALCFTYGARLGKFYGLPCRGGGANNSAKGLSVQSGYESMMVMLPTCLERMNLIIHSAGMLDADAAMSYEKFIIDLEIIGMIQRFIKDITINEETFALDVIKQVGPGGEFLTSDHTLKYCRKEHWVPEISIRGMLNGDKASDGIMDNIRKKQDKMLSEYQQPEMPADIQSRLTSYMKDKGFDLSFVTC